MQNYDRMASLSAKLGGRPPQVIKVPVVVHVLYNQKVENIGIEQIRSQIRVLNQDFRRKNADAIRTPSAFSGIAADTEIEFVLANRDPSGRSTNGITRTYTNKESFAAFSDEMKYRSSGGINAWPSTDYLNIWVCNMSMGVLGFAQFPGGPKETDGVVIGYKFFGTTGTVRPPFNLGRTTTHEIGHWLNLRHIWGDQPCGDDQVADTPPASGPHHGCVNSDFSCGSQDMVQNFMDYTDDACMNLFTKGQRYRMRSLFAPGGPRNSILRLRGFQEAPQPQPAPNPDTPIACGAPASLQASNIQESTGIIRWAKKPGISTYEVRMRRLPDGDWKSKKTQNTYANISRLYSCTQYEFQVRSYCSNGVSKFSRSKLFKTKGCEVQEVPIALGVKRTLPFAAQLVWSGPANAQGYYLQYLKAGTKNVKSVEISKPTAIIRGLEPGTSYYFRVKSLITGRYSAYSKAFKFQTPGSNTMTARLGRDRFVEIYPNPVSDYIHIQLPDPPMGTVRVHLKDELGGTHFSREIRLQADTPHKMSTQNLVDGNYLLVLSDDKGFHFQQEIEIRKSSR